MTGIGPSGSVGSALVAMVPNAEVHAAALEFGTIPSAEVRLALRADNWLHLHGNPDSKLGRIIKADIRKRLYPDEDDWKDMVALRSQHILNRSVNGLRKI